MGNKMKSLGMPMPMMDTGDFKIDLNAGVNLMEGFAKLLESTNKLQTSNNLPVINLREAPRSEGEGNNKSKKKGNRKK